MEILVLTNEFDAEFFGGSGRAVTGMVKSLAGKNIHQTIIVPTSRNEIPVWQTIQWTQSGQIKVLQLPRSSLYFGHLGLIQAEKILADYPELRKDWDIIHLHAINFTPLAYSLSQGSIPVLYSVHSFIRQELDDDGSADLKAQFLLQEEVLMRCQNIHLLSRSQWEYLNTHYPQYAFKGFVLPLGVPSPSINWNGASGYFLYIGRLRNYKGVEDLIQASYLLEKKAIRFKVKIVGGGERHYEQLLKSKIHQYKLEGIVHLTGWVEDEKMLSQWRQESGVLVVPSWRESFGLTALEGMAIGMPLIISDIPALTELISPDCGLVYPARDIKGLAQAMLHAINYPSELKEKGKRAWIKAQNYYWSHLSEAYFNLYTAISKAH